MLEHLRNLTEVALGKKKQLEEDRKTKERERLVTSAKQSIKAVIDNIVQFPVNLENIAKQGKNRFSIHRCYTKCSAPTHHSRGNRGYTVYTGEEIALLEEFFNDQVKSKLKLTPLVVPSCGLHNARNVWWDFFVSWE